MKKLNDFEGLKIPNIQELMGGKTQTWRDTYDGHPNDPVDSNLITAYSSMNEAIGDGCNSLSCNDGKFDAPSSEVRAQLEFSANVG